MATPITFHFVHKRGNYLLKTNVICEKDQKFNARLTVISIYYADRSMYTYCTLCKQIKCMRF